MSRRGCDVAQTPSGVSTPYATAADLFVYHDWQQVADLLRDGDGPRPTRVAMADTTGVPGSLLSALLLAASGELESACLIGNRYSTADLQALTGSGLARLKKLVADLAFWTLAQRRQPGASDPDKVPGAKQALAELDRLRDGQRIFGLAESAEAGLPDTREPVAGENPSSTLSRASPLFGDHGTGYRRDCP